MTTSVAAKKLQTLQSQYYERRSYNHTNVAVYNGGGGGGSDDDNNCEGYENYVNRSDNDAYDDVMMLSMTVTSAPAMAALPVITTT